MRTILLGCFPTIFFYPTFAVVLYGISSFILCSAFESITQDVTNMTEIAATDICRIRNRKRRHLLACQAAVKLNNCYGWTLLITSLLISITTINSAFRFMADGISYFELWFAILHVMLLIAVCFSSNNIHNKVVLITFNYFLSYLMI